MARKMGKVSTPLLHNNALERAFGVAIDVDKLGSSVAAAAEYNGVDWGDPEIKAKAAKSALTINDQDVALRNLFSTVGLSHENPFHWRRLLSRIFKYDSGRNKKPGRKEKWTDLDLCVLLKDYELRKAKYFRENGFYTTEEKICGSLSVKRSYWGFKVETILRNLQRARNPKKNLTLGRIVSGVAGPLVKRLESTLEKGDPKLAYWIEKINSETLAQSIKALSAQDLGWSRSLGQFDGLAKMSSGLVTPPVPPRLPA